MKARSVMGIAAVAVIAAGVGWHFSDGTSVAQPAPEPQLVPVTVAKAEKQDVKVYLDGLGTVQAFNIVQVKSQVNGNLVALPAKEGEEVHKGDIVAEIDPRPYQAALDQAMAQRQEDQAQVQSAQLNLERYRDLAKRNDATIQQVDDQTATVNKENAAIAADDAAVETARINLGYCVIRAPIDGRISLYQVDVGNLVQAAAATSIITITQDKPIAMVFTLPENQISTVEDAAAHGPLPVLVNNGQDDKVIATGELMTPNNQIDTTSGTISLKAKFENQDNHLWPGQFVNARIQVNLLHDAVTIPTLAVQHGPANLFVYTVKPDQTVDETQIEIGYEDNGRTVVTKGLSGNETVALTGQTRLAPGTKVKVTNQPAQGTGSAVSPS